MACESQRQAGQTPEQRRKEINESLRRLESAIKAGSVRVVVGKQGAVAFADWSTQDRRGITDACAVRAVSQSFEVKLALQRAEALAGRKVDLRAVASGTHSHDGGKTWHQGH